MFSKILIANRGEIAVRIIRACKEMGVSTVSVFSEADSTAMHVGLADESYCIGPALLKNSYLNMGAILTIAAASGAQAIHPGYGLLSENAKFAALCEKCGIKFIGPDSGTISRMGDKNEARIMMKDAGVPVIPGSDIIMDAVRGRAEAARIGYPVMIKARAGGGGRGIRIVLSENDFEPAFLAAMSEAKSAFGDGEVYIEKFLSPVKHIEVQFICDEHGNTVCLGERECSVQRKNQKIIEESPSSSVKPKIRKEMYEAAKKAAKAVGYSGVGTIEFLLDKDKNFYFMEMNTRLQVEHPVTEMVTGIDLVKWQIRVAAGIELDFKESGTSLRGHAIECRINAEDPLDNFRPSCGKIELLHFPGGPWVRFDTAVYQDYVIPPFYDSLIGKLIVHAKTREEAIRKMRAALCELVIEGIHTNIDLHSEILSDHEFSSGKYTTDFLSRKDYI
ncbi:MAG: acetyl-CoA carboxylase biotin carboxylase subunit [Eubacteriales bacterium]|nr:acetyl-CoA carboxylase biotin carboxylase subunit [Eubacteriales bacterium]MDD4422039.1 acetyl-CoA carboxylase biotin carboxylase subunit [Eubacteriales bacterium]